MGEKKNGRREGDGHDWGREECVMGGERKGREGEVKMMEGEMKERRVMKE